jgi:hypothetical protein
MSIEDSRAVDLKIADPARRGRLVRRCAAFAAFLVWMAVWKLAKSDGEFDFQGWAIFGAWQALWGALIAALWTDLDHWFAKVFFGLCIVASLANLGEALGYIHFGCPLPRALGESITIGPSDCLPRLGPAPELN